MKHLIWDTELLGFDDPIFFVRLYCPEDNKHYKFWFDKPKDMDKLFAMMGNTGYTWVGFNSKNFDSVITSGIVGWGMTPHDIKHG